MLLYFNIMEGVGTLSFADYFSGVKENGLPERAAAMVEKILSYKTAGAEEIIGLEPIIEDCADWFDEEYDAARQYFIEISKVPQLRPGEQEELVALIAQRDKEAEQRLAEAYLWLPAAEAKYWERKGVGLLECLEEGNIGLLNAVNRWSMADDASFEEYAVRRIRRQIRSAYDELLTRVRVAQGRHRMTAIIEAYHRLRDELSRIPTAEEVSEASGYSIDSVRYTLLAIRKDDNAAQNGED